ncbi:qcr9 subunit 9 of the ubiquinol cytochrome-c reductase complex [Kalmusia sp. IMI 367209]|nr:qcr9 subunit 9 of the ubiquinol cytochrome-c reductase complex [Kalmusia sp. IMI 367209]
MLGTVFAGAFALQLYVDGELPSLSDSHTDRAPRAFDTGSDRIWDSVNKGRQWKDIKYKYVQQAEDDDE